MNSNVKFTTSAATKSSFSSLCLASCKQLIGGIKRVKRGIFNQFQHRFGSHEQVLRLTLNEAEALAWQTGFPQLVFPTLALEKVQAAFAWEKHQQAIQLT